MLKAFLKNTAWVLGVLPALVAALYGLLQAGDAAHLQENPTLREQLRGLIDLILAFMIQHWPYWILLSILVGFIWTLYDSGQVEESKTKFDDRRPDGK